MWVSTTYLPTAIKGWHDGGTESEATCIYFQRCETYVGSESYRVYTFTSKTAAAGSEIPE